MKKYKAKFTLINGATITWRNLEKEIVLGVSSCIADESSSIELREDDIPKSVIFTKNLVDVEFSEEK